ncbi:MAG: hypothetical protein ACRBDI_05410 [Alphaproteobacteria bacterium]
MSDETKIINTKVSKASYAPRAWLIANFSNEETKEIFELSQNPDNLKKQIRTNKNIQHESITSADIFLQNIIPRLNKDPIGGEDYATIYESTMTNIAASTSLHEMLLGAKTEQKFHYHPPSGKPVDPTTSIRQVLLYPLHDRETGNGGIKFEWFELENSGIRRDDDEIYSRATGTPIGDKHVVEAKPGQIIMVEFGKGVHHFSGLGFALSAHFHDKETGTRLGSFLGNTATWHETKNDPKNIAQVEINALPLKNNASIKQNFNDLSLIIGLHETILRERLEKHITNSAGKPLHPNTRTALLNDLRLD